MRKPSQVTCLSFPRSHSGSWGQVPGLLVGLLSHTMGFISPPTSFCRALGSFSLPMAAFLRASEGHQQTPAEHLWAIPQGTVLNFQQHSDSGNTEPCIGTVTTITRHKSMGLISVEIHWCFHFKRKACSSTWTVHKDRWGRLGGPTSGRSWSGTWHIADICWTTSSLHISPAPPASCQKLWGYKNIRDKGLWASKLKSGTVIYFIFSLCGWGSNMWYWEKRLDFGVRPQSVKISSAALLSLFASTSTTPGYLDVLVRCLK